MLDINEWSNRLIAHEGMVLKPYLCPKGKLTIGVGRNLEDNPLNSEELKALGDYKHGITVNGAKMLLRNDITRCYNYLESNIKSFKELNSDRQYALVDMCFNLGIDGFKKFRRMIRAIEHKDFYMASVECIRSSYAKQVPKRAKKIAKVIFSGVW